jgi:hypothetical protein
MSPKKSANEFQITIIFQSRPFSENFDKRPNIVIFNQNAFSLSWLAVICKNNSVDDTLPCSVIFAI